MAAALRPLSSTKAPMKHIRLRFTLVCAALVATLLESRRAEAGLEACGDVHVEAEAHCEVEVEGGCVAQCEPIRVEAACAAELYAECDGQCRADVSIECTGGCQADCRAMCDVDPGSFDCRIACNADCQSACSGSCDSNDSECRAACEGTCSAECDANCEITPPRANCEGRCEAACEGSCRGQANLDCQVDCQAGGFAMCEADLVGGCEAQCRRPEGALFCDGQYIDYGNNLEQCIDALEEQLDAVVDVEGTASASCSQGRCEGSAEGSLSCAVAPTHGPGPAAWAVVCFLLLLAHRRRSAA